MSLALQADPPKAGRPRSRFFLVARRIARRFQDRVARAFLRATRRLRDRISVAELEDAVRAGNLDQIFAAVGAHNLVGVLGTDDDLRRALLQASVITGQASADVLAGAGIAARFNSFDPQVVLFARQQVGQLVVAIGDDIREAIRIVVAAGARFGLTVEQQARAIHEVIGLPPNWAAAPSNLAREIREGRFTSTRRLSAIEKSQIRSRIARGTADEAFISRMSERYAESLRRRRALNIARTETLRAAHHGQHESWRQAIRQGVLPATARRAYIVTPDDRLRPDHAAVPGMNPNGVGIDEPFQTPLGPFLNPPIEPNCRCGVGLTFPGLGGVL